MDDDYLIVMKSLAKTRDRIERKSAELDLLRQRLDAAARASE